LRLTPTEHGEPLAKLAAGEMARRERTRGDFVYIRTANDSAGWIKHAEFEPVCP
jgi:hypothetical protein